MIKSKRFRWAGDLAKMEEGRSVFKIKIGTLTGKPRRVWEDNIKEIGINTRNWIDLTQDRGYWRALVNAVLNLRVP